MSLDKPRTGEYSDGRLKREFDPCNSATVGNFSHASSAQPSTRSQRLQLRRMRAMPLSICVARRLDDHLRTLRAITWRLRMSGWMGRTWLRGYTRRVLCCVMQRMERNRMQNRNSKYTQNKDGRGGVS
jgi:hypothetical protein